MPYHRLKDELQSITSARIPWLGNTALPGLLISFLRRAGRPSHDAKYTQMSDYLTAIHPWLSLWFKRAATVIRPWSCYINFIIQTPRVVPSLHFLYDISLDEFRRKLLSREITVNDTEEDGLTILHVRVTLLAMRGD